MTYLNFNDIIKKLKYALYVNMRCFIFQIFKFLKLGMNIYINSNTLDKIFSFQRTHDLKVLVSTIRVTTTVSKSTMNVITYLLYEYVCY